MPTLGDFIPQVKWNLGNRTDIDDKLSLWLRDAYREISMGYDLETLEVQGANVCVPGIDTYDYPVDARAIKALTLIDPSNSSATPVQPRKKNIEIVRRYQLGGSGGTPAVWAGFGGQYIMRPVPNLAFNIEIDYWQKPNITATETDSATINSTEVLLPEDWFEILVTSATQKGHLGLEELDKAQTVRALLNGDPNSAKGWPGMIKERLNRNAAENGISEYGVRPRIRRYTSS
jgi:hypothetical protein